MAGWLVGWLAGWLVCWVVGWVVVWENSMNPIRIIHISILVTRGEAAGW